MRFINILLIFFFSISKLNAQIPITNLNIDNGLSNNSVNYVFKDHYGFMWFGTDDGLNRYDGYGFKIFRNNNYDPASLVHNRVSCLAEDNSGALWVGTKRGLSIYDQYSSKFITPSFISTISKKKEIVTRTINTIKLDPSGNVFVGTLKTGLLIKEGSAKLKQVEFKGKNGKVSPYSVNAITFLNRKVWLVIENYGLYTYDYKKGRLQLQDASISNSNCMISNGTTLWIGSGNGLRKYNVANKQKIYYGKKAGGLLASRVMDLSFHGTELWIATDGGGVNKLDVITGRFNNITSKPQRNTLTSNAVMSIYRDNENRTWLGTLRGGVNIIDIKKNKFTTIFHSPFNNNSIVSDFVFSFCEDTHHNLWVGTDGSGISIWNRKKNNYRSITHQPDDNSSISNNNITSIVKDDSDVIWVATFGGGINKYNDKTNTFERYPCINKNREDKNIWKLFKDSNNDIWAGTCFGSELTYKLNRKTQRFEAFDPKFKYVITFGEDKSGNLWFGTESGQLVRIDSQKGNHKVYNLKHQVRAIYSDKAGNFWVGVQYTGLLKFDPKNEKFDVFTESEGLCNNSVLNIQEDDKGNLWLSTFSGISKFNYKNRKFTNFYKADGLQSNQFSFNASFKLSTGELLFGGIRGFNIFNPEDVRSNSNLPKTLITGIRINNIPIEREEYFKPQKSIYSINELVLPYDKAVISVDFATLEYSSSDKISYAYYLQGWDHIWNYSGQSRTANYSRLREGEYLLRIKSTNPEGLWAGNERVLKLIVLPPFYRTWWAYSLYLIITMAAIYCYNRYRIRQAELKYAVQIANINTENERKLNEKKISFFTNIAHEFRTPLTLIINPIKELFYSKGKSVDVNDLSGVYRNTRRLLSLVDQLLLFTRAESGEDKLKVVKFNLYNLCQEVYLCFANQGRFKKIDFKFTCGSEEIEIFGDREKIEIAIFNLISNAFKFTPEGGQILFSVTESDDEVQIKVKDTGQGIPADVGERLFERFYQVAGENVSFQSGFGIGLFLVKNFITSHKGEVTYESISGVGTEFKIKLLKGKEYLNKAYIYENIPESPLLVDSLLASGGTDETYIAEDYHLTDNSDIDYLLSEQLSILIIDDNMDIRNYIRKIFGKSYNILEAENGNEGLQTAQKFSPDIIISDVNMPGLNGIEVCKRIKENAAMNHIPVILLTSSIESEVKLKGIECGAADYITKPFETEILTARVLNILKSRNTLQQYFYNHITLQSDNLKISPEYKEFFNKCISVIEKHLLVPTFSAKSFSIELGMSYSNLNKKVKIISGRSINEFIRFVRLRKAAEILINSDCNVNEAAFDVGFNDIKYFREQFSKLFGMKPSEYIRKYRKSFHESYKINKKTIDALDNR